MKYYGPTYALLCHLILPGNQSCFDTCKCVVQSLHLMSLDALEIYSSIYNGIILLCCSRTYLVVPIMAKDIWHRSTKTTKWNMIEILFRNISNNVLNKNENNRLILVWGFLINSHFLFYVWGIIFILNVKKNTFINFHLNWKVTEVKKCGIVLTFN